MEQTSSPVFATQALPLRAQLSELFSRAEVSESSEDILAVVVPDSNLVSGGDTAACVYKQLDSGRYETVIILSSSQIGGKKQISICSLGDYASPLGSVRVDDTLRNELCDEDDDIFLDDHGHFQGRGVDVQLPFLQSRLEEFTLIPIVMGVEESDYCEELGHAIGEIMFNRSVLLVVCAELVGGSAKVVSRFRQALESYDVEGFSSMVYRDGDLRVRGKGPLLVAMLAAKYRKADTIRILNMDAPEEGKPGYIGAIISRS
jgi:MEMO1 family protein